ncbi:MAG: GTP cyclohydrolase I FolE [Hyphomicrobiaceae bacterium]|nr:GTP cyclohydrolase I FolE [Hyphomicrobiaceae bacterium]
MAIDKVRVERAVRMFLEGIGEDPDRPGLRETPKRVAKMCEELFYGIGVDAASLVKVVPIERDYDEIILERDIPFASFCEHHLLPFIGHAHVAYLPHPTRITGLSKLARLVSMEAAKPQVQERMTANIADALERALAPRGVMVVIEAEHMCMSLRGARARGSVTVTSVVRGKFREDPRTRMELLSLLRGRSHGVS